MDASVHNYVIQDSLFSIIIAMHVDSIEAGLEVPLHHIVMLIYSLNYDFYHHKQITFIIITS